MHKAFVDGACRPNPGRGAYGFIIYNAKGKELKRENGSAGENVTSNVAEYTAIIRALKAAIAMNIGQLAVFSDSQVTVRQLNGDCRVCEPRLKKLHSEALSLLEGFEKVVFVYIRRHQNIPADSLANEFFAKTSAVGRG